MDENWEEMRGDWESERRGHKGRKFDAAVVLHPMTEEVAQAAYEAYGPEFAVEPWPVDSPMIPTLYAVG
jgi:hypothetical protein